MARLVRQYGVALIFCLSAILFWRLRIIEPATFAAGLANADFFTQIYPMFYRASRMILDAQIPLWNPYQFCGHPFLATFLYGIFYPLNFLFLLFPTEVAIEYTTILHLFLSGFFMFLYVRSIGLSLEGSLVGAFTFMFAGYEVRQAVWYTSVFCATVWLPLAFFALERIVHRQRYSYSCLLALAVGMPILSGRLQIWVYMMYGVLAYAALHITALLIGRNLRGAVRVFLLVMSGIIVGLALSAVQLLPTAELSQMSTREPGGLSLRQALAFGVTGPQSLLAEAVTSRAGYPRSAYLGILALVLIPLSLFGRAGLVRLACLWGMAGASVGVALTIYTPLFDIYRLLPTGTWFRSPQRILFLYAFAGAALTAIGAEVIVEALRSQQWPRKVLVAIKGTVLALGVAYILHVPRPGIWYLALGILFLWALTVFKDRRAQNLLLMGVLALLVCDLSYASRNTHKHPYHDLGILHRAQHAFNYIKLRQGLDRTYIHNPSTAAAFNYSMMAKQGTLRGLYIITDYEPLSLRRYYRFFQLLESPLARRDRRYPFAGQLLADPSLPNFRLLKLMSVRYALVHKSGLPFIKGLLSRAPKWRPVFRSQGYAVFEAGDFLPRAYVVPELITANDGEEALQIITSPSFDPHKAVVVEVSGRDSDPRDLPTSGRMMPARIASYGSSKVVVEVTSSSPGYLVLTDTFYPGWKAFVDGGRAPIYRANYLFRAVPVEAGQHTVLFTYDPGSFKVGLALTIAACCWIGIWIGRSAYSTWWT